VTLRHEGRSYRVQIRCLGRGQHGHRHQAVAKVDDSLVTGAGGTQDEALAALIKAIDPEVETVRDERGARLA
jgi:hypothetical protein